LKDSRLFDDGFFLYFEEVELMHRMRARNWTVRYVPASRVTHIEGASTGVGATAAVRPLPHYWYRSRRRYFGLTGSHGALAASNIAWFAGNAIAQLRTLGGRTPINNRVRIRDLLRSSRSPAHADRDSSAPSWGDPPGKLPAWMAAK
jgi:N-acetylglucosaminyl-diphospho-decaprenol L-rhamnosyltransferase